MEAEIEKARKKAEEAKIEAARIAAEEAEEAAHAKKMAKLQAALASATAEGEVDAGAPPRPTAAMPVYTAVVLGGPLPLEQNAWFHGSISRPQCEVLLMGATCQPGSFLVRESTRGDNSYSLSVRDNTGAKVKHIQIYKAGAAWKLNVKFGVGVGQITQKR